MKSKLSALRALVLISTVAFAGVSAHAQATNSGDIVGTVTDPSGARVPDVTVIVTNLDTGIVKTITTNHDGLYDTSSIVVGSYSVSFSKPGFANFERSSITLQVGTTTVNASLKVGGDNQQVVVNDDVPLLTTDTGAQSTTLDAKSMQVLPNVGQDWENFAILIPGASGSSGSQGTVNPGQEISANGNLPYSNVLSDGASTTLGTSQNSDVNTFETVQEVQISTSAFSAQYGIGGIIFNQISKGGTSHFHGSAYDYFQSDEFNANSYQFPGQSNKLAFLRMNNFGGSVGGPVDVPLGNIKKKAFFYFNYDQIVNHGQATQTNTIPTPEVMAGNFPTQRLLYDPTTQTIAHDSKGNPYPVRQSFLAETGSNSIPANLMSRVAQNFQKFYPTATDHLAGGHFQTGNLTGSTGVQSNNFYAAVPVSNPDRKYFGRIDYDITPKNRITGSVTQGDIPAFSPNEVTQCPVGCGSSDVSRLNVQISDVWTISPRLINEARFGFTYQGNFFYDQTSGKGYPQQLGWNFAKYDEIPSIQFYNTYPYAWIEAGSGQFVYKENIFDPSDVVTFILGKHLLHFGGEVGVYRNDNTPYAAINPGLFGFTGTYTSHWSLVNGVAQQDSGSGAEYADFLMGNANSWSASVAPEYGARLKNPQFFVQDDWKLRPNLTVNLGIRYQIRFGYNEVHGSEGTYDPTVLNPATNTPGAYWYSATHANGRTALQAPTYGTVLPRVGFSWLPHPDTTVRGGFGVYAYNLSLDTYGGGVMGTVTTPSGNYTDPTNGITPGILLDGQGTENASGAPLPYALPGTSPTRFNGQGVNYFAYHTPDPKIYQWNLAVEHAIGTNMSFELAYVGSHGFDLNFPTDLNQVPTADLSSNDAQFRPNPNYTSIDGSTNNAISNYNSMQATVKRRLSQGLSFNLNYTWSHFLDTQDSSGWGSRSGPQNRQYQDAASNYSNSNFDVRNAFKGNVVYELPFGKGRMFMNKSWLLDEVLGGYQLSSTLQLTSGQPFSVFASNQNTYAEPGTTSPFPNYSGAQLYPSKRTNFEWYNPAAFTLPANGTFGNVRRNSLYGPGIEYVNLSAGKKFDIHGNVKLQIRLDATNAFNHPSFGQPNGNLSVVNGQGIGQAFQQSSFGTNGQISGVQVGGRDLQGGVRLEF